MTYTDQGTRVPWEWCPQAIANGIEWAAQGRRFEPLYRWWWSLHGFVCAVLYVLGFLAGKIHAPRWARSQSVSPPDECTNAAIDATSLAHHPRLLPVLALTLCGLAGNYYPAHAASVDAFLGGMSANGDSGTDPLLGVGLDIGLTEYLNLASRVTRTDLEDGYATGLTVAGEWGLRGALYATAGAGLTWYEREGVDEARISVGSDSASCATFPPGQHKGGCPAPPRDRVTVTRRDGDSSALHLQGGIGALIPARAVSIQVEAVYRLPVHEGDGGIVGTVGVQVPLP